MLTGCQAAGPPQPVPLASTESYVAALVQQLSTDATRQKGREQIVALGASAIPALLTQTSHPEPMVRWEIVNLFGIIVDARALPALVRSAVEDDNPHVRWRSFWALSNYPAETVIGRLRDELSRDNFDIRWNAAVGLSVFEVADGLSILHGTIRLPRFAGGPVCR